MESHGMFANSFGYLEVELYIFRFLHTDKETWSIGICNKYQNQSYHAHEFLWIIRHVINSLLLHNSGNKAL